MLPREHGAWAMWIVPYLLGSFLGGWGTGSLLLLVSMLFLFISSRPAELVLIRPAGTSDAMDRRSAAFRRLAAFGGMGVAAGAALLLEYHLWALLPLGVAATLGLGAMLPLKARRLDRTWPARLLSIAALSTMGPAAYYAGSGTLDHRAFAIWLLSFLYSGAGVFYVRLFHRPAARKPSAAAADPRKSAEKALFLYLAVAVALSVALAAVEWAPPLAVLALGPFLAKAVWAILHRGYQPTLKQLGVGEIGHATVFAITAFAVMAIWG